MRYVRNINGSKCLSTLGLVYLVRETFVFNVSEDFARLIARLGVFLLSGCDEVAAWS